MPPEASGASLLGPLGPQRAQKSPGGLMGPLGPHVAHVGPLGPHVGPRCAAGMPKAVYACSQFWRLKVTRSILEAVAVDIKSMAFTTTFAPKSIFRQTQKRLSYRAHVGPIGPQGPQEGGRPPWALWGPQEPDF